MCKAKLYNADGAVLSTFTHTGISFIVGVPNEDLSDLSSGFASAQRWVRNHVLAHIPATKIIAITVGNEVLSGNDTTLMNHLVPAIQHIYDALVAVDLHKSIMISSAHSFATVSTSFPPSSGTFESSIASRYMKPLLKFLDNTSNPFFINIYPFFPYKENPLEVPLDYALFLPNSGVFDARTGLRYYNLFDAQLDAVYTAMSALGYANISLLVSETGWPSAGDPNETGASVDNAQIYHNNLISHLRSQTGTPLRPNTSFEVYLFALFNENLKPGFASERNFGLFKPDGSMVFDFQVISMPTSFSSFSQCFDRTTHLLLILLPHFLLFGLFLL